MSRLIPFSTLPMQLFIVESTIIKVWIWLVQLWNGCLSQPWNEHVMMWSIWFREAEQRWNLVCICLKHEGWIYLNQGWTLLGYKQLATGPPSILENIMGRPISHEAHYLIISRKLVLGVRLSRHNRLVKNSLVLGSSLVNTYTSIENNKRSVAKEWKEDTCNLHINYT